MAKPWSDVAQSDAYQALPPEEQDAARQQYFTSVVAPMVPKSDRAMALEQFNADTAPKTYTAPEDGVSLGDATGSGFAETANAGSDQDAGAGRGHVNPLLVGQSAPQTSGSTTMDLVRNFRSGLLGTVAGAGSTLASVAGADDVAASLDSTRQDLQADAQASGGDSVAGKAANIAGSVVPAFLLPASKVAQLVGNAGLFAIPAFRDTLKSKLDEGQSFPLALAHASEAFGINLFMPTVATRGSGAVVKALGVEGKGAAGAATALGQAGAEGSAFSAANSVLDKGTDLAAGQQNDKDWVDLKDVAANAVGFGVLRGAHIAPEAANAIADRIGSKSQQIGRAFGQDVDSAQFDTTLRAPQTNPNLAQADPISKIADAQNIDEAIAATTEAVGTNAHTEDDVAGILNTIRPAEVAPTLEQELAALNQRKAALDQPTEPVAPEILAKAPEAAPEPAPVAEPAPEPTVAPEPVAPRFETTDNPSGTVSIKGDPAQIRQKLGEAGITSTLTTKDGITVGVSQAARARELFAKSDEPASVWFGRAGDGYKTEADATMAMPSRQRVAPELAWKIEPMPNGKFRLAGYADEVGKSGDGIDTRATAIGDPTASREQPSAAAASVGEREAVLRDAALPAVDVDGAGGARAVPPEVRTEPGRDALPAERVTLNRDGTATVLHRGDKDGTRLAFKDAGITNYVPVKDGYSVGKSQADKALKLFAQPQEKAPQPLSLGIAPGSAEPVTVRNGVVHVGEHEAINFDSGEPITVRDGASNLEIKQALRDGGAVSRKAKFFGGSKESALPAEFTPENRATSGYEQASPEVKAEVNELVAHAESGGIELPRILADTAKAHENSSPFDHVHAAREAISEALGAGREDRGSTAGEQARPEERQAGYAEAAHAEHRPEHAEGVVRSPQADHEAAKADVAARRAKQDEAGDQTSFATGERDAEPSFSREEFSGQVERIAGRLGGRNDVRPVWSADELPDSIKEAAERAGVPLDKIRGVITGKANEVYIVGSAHSDLAHVQETVFHELYGHYGLRKLFGNDIYSNLSKIYAQLGQTKFRALAEKYGLNLETYNRIAVRQTAQHPKAAERAGGSMEMRNGILAEELLAHIAQHETGKIQQLAKEVIGGIRQWLRSHGFAKLAEYGETDLAHLLKQGRDAIVRESPEAPGFLVSDDAAQAFSVDDDADERGKGDRLADKLPYTAYAGVERVPRESKGSIADSIAKALVPAGRKDAAITSGIIRGNLGEQARGREVAQQHLMEFAKEFDRMPVDENYKFIDAMERGVPLKDADLSRAAVAIRKVLDERRDQVIALGKGNLENFNENYFPHIWKDKTAAAQFFTRRPLEGGKGFLKQRTYDYFSDGLKAGLEPVTTNPVELAMLKAREMDRYIYGQRIFAEMKAAGVAKFVGFGDKAPDGWVKINDKIARVMQYSDAEKAMILRGEYYAPEQAATLINNHLSPGLSGIAAFDMVRKAGNMMNAAQLGLSAFHLGFTTLDAMISKAALGIKQTSRGDVLKGMGSLAQSLNPAQPVMNLIKGDKLLKAYLGNLNDPELAPIVEALVQAGGRVKMDDVYKNSAANEFRQALRKGNYGSAALKALPRVMDLINKPIFEYLVPRQKLGVFFDMAKDALENKPDMSLDEKRQTMGKLWDSVDNRMGELVYDNVFWNRALKDALMVSVRSVGWNLGTFREIGGGIKDFKDVAKIGGLSDRTAYLFALPFVTAIIGSLTQYLMTGEAPKEPKDVFFPRTGNTRPDGTEDRLSLPSYMKDIAEYGHDLRNFAKYGDNPFNTVMNKLHPLISTMGQVITNKDFFGGAIRSPGDEPMQQALDEANYALKQITPFSFRNYMQQAKAKGEDPSIAGYLSSPSMIGITPAPGYITKNDEQTESAQVNKMREALITKFREEMRDGADWPEIRQRARDAGITSDGDLSFIRRSAEQRPPKHVKEFASH
jgi:hypothetical protein